MKLFPTRRQIHRAQARVVGRFFAAMLIVTLVFLALLAGRYGLGLW